MPVCLLPGLSGLCIYYLSEGVAQETFPTVILKLSLIKLSSLVIEYSHQVGCT